MKSRKHLVWGMIGLITVLVFTWVGIQAADANVKIGTAVGNRAPDFSLSDLNNQKYHLKEVVGKNQVTLVNFWATWCGPCRAEIPELIRFYGRYSRQKVALLALNLQEKPANVRKFAQNAGMDFPVLLDVAGKIAGAYKVYAIPTTWIIDRNGIIRKVIEGSTNLATLEAEVNAILKEKQ
jgi:peroxiredoxin